MRLGFVTLPDILWRKPTNASYKFMGSEMLPAALMSPMNMSIFS